MSFYTRPLHLPELGDFEQRWLESPPELGGWGASARIYANLQTLSEGLRSSLNLFYLAFKRFLAKFIPRNGRAQHPGNNLLVNSRTDLPEARCRAYAARTPLQQ